MAYKSGRFTPLEPCRNELGRLVSTARRWEADWPENSTLIITDFGGSKPSTEEDVCLHSSLERFPAPLSRLKLVVPCEQEALEYSVAEVKDGERASMHTWRRCGALLTYWRRLEEDYGRPFVIMLASDYLMVKGVMHVVTNAVQLSYFKLLGVDGICYQKFTVIALTPWAMKGLVGAFSDSFALLGYHKRYLMIAASVVGSFALSGLGVIPISVASENLWIPPTLFLLINVQIATLDLLCEGKYTEQMARKGNGKPDIVTFVWGAITLGSLGGASFNGVLTDILGPRVIFWLLLPLAMQVIVPLNLGFLPEVPVPKGLANSFDWAKLQEEKPYFLLALTTAIAALGLVPLCLFASILTQLLYSAVTSVFLVVLTYRTLPTRLAHCNLYMFLQDALYIGLSGGIDYWYTLPAANASVGLQTHEQFVIVFWELSRYTANPKTCVEGGPGFDYSYYQTYAHLMGYTATAFALWFFQAYISRWRLRHVYWGTTLLRIVASLFDLIMVKRWNVTILGIHDKLMYLFGDAIVLPICTTLNLMPGVILTARLCPAHMEATVYAILAGFSNFGAAMARTLGVFALTVAGVKTTPPDCDFTNLPTLILMCHGLVPCFLIPITFFLVPDHAMNEPFEARTMSDRGHQDVVLCLGRLATTRRKRFFAGRSKRRLWMPRKRHRYLGDLKVDDSAFRRSRWTANAKSSVLRPTSAVKQVRPSWGRREARGKVQAVRDQLRSQPSSETRSLLRFGGPWEG